MRLKPVTALSAAVLAAGLAVGGCSSQTGTSSPPSSTTATASPSVTVSTSKPSTAVPTDDATVDANTASQSEIEAALTEAGVPNAAKWADEIEEYRPYTAADLKAKLTQELGKYNVDQATLTKILSVLTVG